MSTRSAARKAEPWSSFLYSDPEGFQVKTVQFANGTTGRGLFADRNFDDKEFLLTYWGPRSTTKTSNFDYVMEVQEGKQAVFIDTSDEKNSRMARFINDKDRTVGVNCRMKKVIASSWQLAQFSLVSLNFLRDRKPFKTQCESHQVPMKKGPMSHQVLIEE